MNQEHQHGIHCRQRVVIIGGGASGVLMAAHLLRQPSKEVEVTIIERSRLLGCGIAYNTADPGHLLNTRASQMSAFPDDPSHFERWLESESIPVTGTSFVDRGTYGRYLASLLRSPHAGENIRRLHCVHGECMRLIETEHGVIAELDDGRTIHADRAVLATGHAVPAEPLPPLRGAWDFELPHDADAVVAIIGTGLSMVDHMTTLLGAGHRGPIYCLSRRGLFPQTHETTHPLVLEAQGIPFGASVSRTMYWLRSLVRLAEAQGGTWRDAIDGVRPHVAEIWGAWPLAEKARFLRHAASWWEVHRHRMPPVSAGRISRAAASGQLRVLRGSFESAEERADGRIMLNIVPRKSGIPEHLIADHVIDCRGIRRNPAEHAAPVIRDLLTRGAARLDPLGLGLDTTLSAQLIDVSGKVSQRISAIGPAARGALWEITAIPDIRAQTHALARGFLKHARILARQRGLKFSEKSRREGISPLRARIFGIE
ncbi:FAD/NAD(P)-binding protein [Paracoccus alkanivorans]|uniref:FAD-dependent oxidoreductase n=1 Tax=Paracoccus alkanivorans TaxID=2116655 RepID=A0A3M0MK00_9RHOB|nr:FAD/NAD(P)-binding protein [Paracoccus alkanivorans]RMC37931.1 FAD-dependent oxidoreductase [Paracoccus alkanivorans]